MMLNLTRNGERSPDLWDLPPESLLAKARTCLECLRTYQPGLYYEKSDS
jgi:hypothetical protein